MNNEREAMLCDLLRFYEATRIQTDKKSDTIRFRCKPPRYSGGSELHYTLNDAARTISAVVAKTNQPLARRAGEVLPMLIERLNRRIDFGRLEFDRQTACVIHVVPYHEAEGHVFAESLGFLLCLPAAMRMVYGKLLTAVLQGCGMHEQLFDPSLEVFVRAGLKLFAETAKPEAAGSYAYIDETGAIWHVDGPRREKEFDIIAAMFDPKRE